MVMLNLLQKDYNSQVKLLKLSQHQSNFIYVVIEKHILFSMVLLTHPVPGFVFVKNSEVSADKTDIYHKSHSTLSLSGTQSDEGRVFM